MINNPALLNQVANANGHYLCIQPPTAATLYFLNKYKLREYTPQFVFLHHGR
jgi:hypothetical protein